jgi:hypothetical protein
MLWKIKALRWFPLLHRFMWSMAAFRYAWKHHNIRKWWGSGYVPWLRENSAFSVGDYQYIKGVCSDPIHPKLAPLPNGLEPFMLKKTCVDADGNVRYFDVVPEGYERWGN